MDISLFTLSPLSRKKINKWTKFSRWGSGSSLMIGKLNTRNKLKNRDWDPLILEGKYESFYISILSFHFYPMVHRVSCVTLKYIIKY